MRPQTFFWRHRLPPRTPPSFDVPRQMSIYGNSSATIVRVAMVAWQCWLSFCSGSSFLTLANLRKKWKLAQPGLKRTVQTASVFVLLVLSFVFCFCLLPKPSSPYWNRTNSPCKVTTSFGRENGRVCVCVCILAPALCVRTRFAIVHSMSKWPKMVKGFVATRRLETVSINGCTPTTATLECSIV